MKRPSLRPLSERRPTRAQISAEQLASLSHEFRTPLNGVLGMARLLESTRLTAEQKTYVSALHDSGQHLLTLVNTYWISPSWAQAVSSCTLITPMSKACCAELPNSCRQGRGKRVWRLPGRSPPICPSSMPMKAACDRFC